MFRWETAIATPMHAKHWLNYGIFIWFGDKKATYIKCAHKITHLLQQKWLHRWCYGCKNQRTQTYYPCITFQITDRGYKPADRRRDRRGGKLAWEYDALHCARYDNEGQCTTHTSNVKTSQISAGYGHHSEVFYGIINYVKFLTHELVKLLWKLVDIWRRHGHSEFGVLCYYYYCKITRSMQSENIYLSK